MIILYDQVDRVPDLVERLAGCMEDTQTVKSGNVTHMAIQRWAVTQQIVALKYLTNIIQI